MKSIPSVPPPSVVVAIRLPYEIHQALMDHPAGKTPGKAALKIVCDAVAMDRKKLNLEARLARKALRHEARKAKAAMNSIAA